MQLRNTLYSSNWWYLQRENAVLNEASQVDLMNTGRHLRESYRDSLDVDAGTQLEEADRDTCTEAVYCCGKIQHHYIF